MEVICFADLIVGNSKEATWYDYGFFAEPQGPIEGGDKKKKLDGFKVREAADYLLNYYGIEGAKEAVVLKTLKGIASRRTPSDKLATQSFYISIFSRTKDRLILNESDLARQLEQAFGLPVKLVQLENLGFNEILQIMSRTLIGIGLHGSALIFAMFMPRHAILLEMFPYTVPGENYLPYRTLSLLPGVDLNYRAWGNGNNLMDCLQVN
jgi:protein O-mannose beta-1,4-N-acetylglucosaminyltransferase